MSCSSAGVACGPPGRDLGAGYTLRQPGQLMNHCVTKRGSVTLYRESSLDPACLTAEDQSLFKATAESVKNAVSQSRCPPTPQRHQQAANSIRTLKIPT